MVKKWHVGCGGRVLNKEPLNVTYFATAGECQKCNEYPLSEEDLIFEISTEKVEIFTGKKELKTWKWEIIYKSELKEKLE